MTTKLPLPEHRMAWDAFDWNDSDKAYDCFTLPLGKARELLLAQRKYICDDDVFLSSAIDELEDLALVLNHWLKRNTQIGKTDDLVKRIHAARKAFEARGYLFIEDEGNYLTVIDTEQKKTVCCGDLSELEDWLDSESD